MAASLLANSWIQKGEEVACVPTLAVDETGGKTTGVNCVDGTCDWSEYGVQ